MRKNDKRNKREWYKKAAKRKGGVERRQKAHEKRQARQEKRDRDNQRLTESPQPRGE